MFSDCPTHLTKLSQSGLKAGFNVVQTHARYVAWKRCADSYEVFIHSLFITPDNVNKQRSHNAPASTVQTQGFYISLASL